MTESSDPATPAAFSYPGHGPNASIGIAICHGFTGSPLSILPWAEYLAERGFAVSVPLLPGHGTDWQDLARTGWPDWHGAFEKAYLELAGRTEACFVAGLSMGGAIALLTASRHSVAGVAVVNPGLSFYDRRVRIVGLLKYFQRTTIPIEEENPTAAPTQDGDYSRTPLEAVHQLKRLFAAAIRGLPRITAPVLVFKSLNDVVVPPTSLAMLKARLGTVRHRQGNLETVLLENSGHVATLDVDAPEIFAASARFFQVNAGREHAGTEQPGTVHPGVSATSNHANSAISSEK
ncbi:MAG: alpha/beta fold hydrolase [Actinomycetota bacterium]|nr:alpha/beta fold hydrolase [Actinomycetota bacterium]